MCPRMTVLLLLMRSSNVGYSQGKQRRMCQQATDRQTEIVQL